MMKVVTRLILSLAVVVVLVLLLANFVGGYSPKYLYNVPNAVTSIGARLACSLHFVTGYDKQQTAKDIGAYSPFLKLLRYDYDEQAKTASATFFGLKKRTAHFLPRIGCSLEYPGYYERADIKWPPMSPDNAAWPRGDNVLTIVPEVQKKLDAMLKRDNLAGFDTRAMVVVHNGNIVAESYAEGITSDTVLLGWSLTKSINALILGHMEMLGRINVKHNHLFPAWDSDERKHISIENMLQMTDGLDIDETYDPGDPALKMLFESPSVAQFMLRIKARNKAGEVHNYSSGIANLISYLVLMTLSGDIQADTNFLVENIFRPMGMTSVTFETDATGLYLGSSYLYATARDWAKVGQLMLNGGTINRHRVVSEDYVRRSVLPNSSKNYPAYGYQWWLNTGNTSKLWPDLPDNAFAARGNREQRILVLPDKQLVIVRLGWSSKDYVDNQNFSAIQSWFP